MKCQATVQAQSLFIFKMISLNCLAVLCCIIFLGDCKIETNPLNTTNITSPVILSGERRQNQNNINQFVVVSSSAIESNKGKLKMVIVNPEEPDHRNRAIKRRTNITEPTTEESVSTETPEKSEGEKLSIKTGSGSEPKSESNPSSSENATSELSLPSGAESKPILRSIAKPKRGKKKTKTSKRVTSLLYQELDTKTGEVMNDIMMYNLQDVKSYFDTYVGTIMCMGSFEECDED